jgi:hypothetical protein
VDGRAQRGGSVFVVRAKTLWSGTFLIVATPFGLLVVVLSTTM